MLKNFAVESYIEIVKPASAKTAIPGPAGLGDRPFRPMLVHNQVEGVRAAGNCDDFIPPCLRGGARARRSGGLCEDAPGSEIGVEHITAEAQRAYCRLREACGVKFSAKPDDGSAKVIKRRAPIQVPLGRLGRQRLARVIQKRGQQLLFVSCKHNRFSLWTHELTRAQIPRPARAWGGSFRASHFIPPEALAPNQGAGAGQDLPFIHRLGQVVVRSGLQGDHPVQNVRSPVDHDHRTRDVGGQKLAKGDRTAAVESPLQNNQVELVKLKGGASLKGSSNRMTSKAAGY